MALTPEQLMYYSQAMGGTMPQQQPPAIDRYAQPQVPQQMPQVAQYSGLQALPGRPEYVNAIEQRFQELAKQAGGMDRLARTGLIETARQKAMQDVAMLYGAPPTAPQPMQIQQIPGTNRMMVSGGGLPKPEFIETPQQQAGGMQLAPVIGPDGQPIPGMGMMPSGEVKTFEPPTKATETKAKAAAENMTLVSDVVSSVDNLLSDEAALQWAGGMTGAILGRVPGQTSGIRQRIEQLRDQIGLFGRKAIVGQGQGSISDSEQKMAKEALAQIVTEGTDEQLISSLKAVRQKFGGIMDRLQSETTGSQNGVPVPQPTPEGVKRRVFVPGKGFQ
jgi:hypothetical protein